MAKRRGRESNYQFDSRPRKVGSRLNLLGCKQSATYCWKVLDESYNFFSDYTSIRGLLAKLWGSKVPRIPIGRISGVPRGSPGREKPFGCGPRGEVQGEPLAERGATAPSVIREIEEVQGREQVPRDGGLAFSKDVTMKPLGPKGPLNIKLLILAPILSRGPNGLPGGHANFGSGLPGLEEDSLQGVLTVKVLTAPFGP